MDFPGVRALDQVSLTFQPGEVHGIVGENGAGKSTLMKILAGLQAPTGGTILIDGSPVTLRSVRDSIDYGIAMIHQELNLVDELSVSENIFLGKEWSKCGVLRGSEMENKTNEYLQLVRAKFSAKTKVKDLKLADRQLVEIAKALSYEASTLIMDEPTAVLTEKETAILFNLIRELQARGVCIIYISHRLAEVEAICTTVSVLRDGRLVKTAPAADLNQAEMASLMVGRPLGDMFPPKASSMQSDPILEVRNLSASDLPKNVSFSISRGEILGIGGLVGSGRTELAETIIGARESTAGETYMNGKQVKLRAIRHAARSGIAYVSEDRKETGLVLSMDVVENTTLANLEEYSKPIIRKSRELAAAESWVKRLDIRVSNMRSAVLFLSGGNQQKVSIAKWLEIRPKVLIIDEPTRGVDVGAKREIYNVVAELASKGTACIVISSEMQELVGLCNRVMVMREGEVAGELRDAEITEENIMALAAGVEAA